MDNGRYIPTRHWQHGDWTVYDTKKDCYRLRGLNEIEAIEYAEQCNRT